MNKAVFFDRDGVLNVDKGYQFKISTFEWIPGAKRAIKLLNELDYLVIVITNQSGVSRGYYNENHVKILHNWMNEELKKQNALINDFFYSTEMPSKEKNPKSRRKPNPIMIFEAMKKYSISKKKSFLVGDKESDIKTAENANIRGYLFKEENLFKRVTEILKEL
tara:strand:+ start:1399 stop:1890 length:492 start_codon:yes stop_codon:yes gene_type:complete